jgi:predicted dehydrogenase
MASSVRQPIRWGIMGTGNIAAQFIKDLTLQHEAVAVAVGSRTKSAADQFAKVHGVATSHGSYADLADDPAVDAVYVATPHPAHHDCGLLAIAAGKATLVEKPFTLNAAEARDLVAHARDRGTFLMEAMWTRFLPHVVKIRELISSGRLGDVRSLTADFGERVAKNAEHRAFSPELGGGALLDLGIYPISFASMLFGTPRRVTATSHPTFTGVDSQTAVILDYEGGRQAIVFTSMEAKTANRASINGTKARIEVEGDFLAPATFTLFGDDGSVEIYRNTHIGRGLRHQVLEVGRCLGEGLSESPVMPLDESIAIMDTLDEIRRMIGLRYPAE